MQHSPLHHCQGSAVALNPPGFKYFVHSEITRPNESHWVTWRSPPAATAHFCFPLSHSPSCHLAGKSLLAGGLQAVCATPPPPITILFSKCCCYSQAAALFLVVGRMSGQLVQVASSERLNWPLERQINLLDKRGNTLNRTTTPAASESTFPQLWSGWFSSLSLV